MGASCTFSPNTTTAAGWRLRKTCHCSALSAKPCACMKRRAKQTKHVTPKTQILFDDADLLHERPAAHWPHLYNRRGGHHPALQADARLRSSVDHGHGRARRERGARSEESWHIGNRIRRRDGCRVARAVG